MGVAMFRDEHLATEFARVVDNFYPKTGEMLHRCYLKVIECQIERLRKRFYYLGIYCPEEVMADIQTQKDVLKEVAENMGLVEVVFLNATRLLRDPKSKLKEQNPRFWLELYWIATQGK
ncbi:hypothetical protein [Kamptonema formosum]|uniref:hypothetical protein n=1 Tax=Kamptonema formosum TaxID=331992 RepID=UPI0018E258C8|nr:hypothetical protein [Oscillatoria sp. PCC 10802]